MRSLPPPDVSAAINDLCKRYSVDLAALSREASMDWDDLAKLAADPLVTIGSATVNYPVLANLKDAAALREMTMGRAVAQAAFHRDVRHLAYPFGDRAAFRRQHVGDGGGGRLCQRGVGDPGRRRGGGPHQSARAAAHRLGRPAAFAAHHARDAVGRCFRAGEAERGKRRAAYASGRDIQLTIGIAGSTQPMPATT